MQALEFLLTLRPALPMSVERPCMLPTNGELRRWLRDGAVELNGIALREADQI